MTQERPRTTPQEWAQVAATFRAVRPLRTRTVPQAIETDGRRQAQIAAAETLAQIPLKATREGNFLVFRARNR